MADDFLQARRGDELYSWKFGRAIIKGIDPNSSKPIIGRTSEGEICWTSTGLLREEDANQDLFWSQPVFDTPDPPVRTQRLSVSLSGWWVVYRKNLYGPWKQKENAQAYIDNQTIPTLAQPEYRTLDWLVVVPEGTTTLPDDRK